MNTALTKLGLHHVLGKWKHGRQAGMNKTWQSGTAEFTSSYSSLFVFSGGSKRRDQLESSTDVLCQEVELILLFSIYG